MLEKTTVLVTTFNRPAGLRRLLEHLAGDTEIRHLGVLDSSALETIAQNAEACRELSGRIEIVHRTYPESMHPCIKWQLGAEAVTTEFLVLSADDDFPIPSTLGQCEEFLAKNPDYAACQGYFLSILRYADGFHLGEDSFNLGREEATPEERVWNQFQNYNHLTYSLRRTSVWRSSLAKLVRIIECLSQENIDGGGMAEMADAMFCLMEGKVKRLPLLHSVRNGMPTFEEAWRSSFVFGPNFSSYICVFKQAFSVSLAEASGRTVEECEELFRRAFAFYFSSVLLSNSQLPAMWKERLAPFDHEKAARDMKDVRERLFPSAPGLPGITALIEKFPLKIDVAPPNCAAPNRRWDYLLTGGPAEAKEKRSASSRILREISRGARKAGLLGRRQDGK